MKCDNCAQEFDSLKRCSVCKGVWYCSKECQNKAWPEHKKGCTAPAPKPEPAKIDGYEMFDVIGRGNFTDIFEAEVKETKERVAIKIAEKQKLVRLHKERDLMVEKHCLNKLKDVDGVIDLFETFQDKFKLYMVMEQADGKELWQRAKIFGFQNKKLAYYYFNRLLKVLAKVHDKQIAHRDLKPENVMVNGAELKLIDFGSAKDIEHKVWSKGNSSTGRKYFEHFMGTPNYMAPECIHNTFSDTRSDIYSLGSFLYFLIVGFPAYIGGSEYLIFKQVTDGEKPLFYEFLFTEEDIANITEMMDHDAEKRPKIDELVKRYSQYDDLKYEEIVDSPDEMDRFFIELTEKFINENEKADKETLLNYLNERKDYINENYDESTATTMKRRLKLLFQQIQDHYNVEEFDFIKF